MWQIVWIACVPLVGNERLDYTSKVGFVAIVKANELVLNGTGRS